MPTPADPGPADPGPAGTDPGGAESASAGTSPRRRWRRRRLTEAVVALSVAAVLSVLLRTYAYAVYYIPSASMVPTLGVNDRIVVQKAFFNWHDVHEGDIVVFTHPPLDQCGGVPAGDLVKRVIALPGQRIYSAGNSIYINGHLLAEPYLPAYDPLGAPIASSRHPYRVPSGEFYVLGDNRADSCDSRFWGPIRGSSIVGRAVMVIWHNTHPELRGL